MSSVRAAIAVFLCGKLAILAMNSRDFPRLERSHDVDCVTDGSLRNVSVLIPARNEEGRIHDTLRSVIQQRPAEILVLNDRSDDATGCVARQLLSEVAPGTQARVVEGSALPEGWNGKTWACHQLAAHASHDVFVFVDADVTFGEDGLRSAMREMQSQRADVFSVLPRQITHTLAERLTLPLIDDVVLCFLPFRALEQPAIHAGVAYGAFLAFTRDAYRAVGGFASVKDMVLEDVAMAWRARRKRLQLGLALGGSQIAIRMYTSRQEVHEGLGRSLRGVIGHRPATVSSVWAWHLVVYTIPWIAVGRDWRWLPIVLLGIAERVGVEHVTGRKNWRDIALLPLTAPATFPIVRRSFRKDHHWKGRRAHGNSLGSPE